MRISSLTIPDTARALLWDLDGVLVDSLSLDLRVCNVLLKQYFGAGARVSRTLIRKTFPAQIEEFWSQLLASCGISVQTPRFTHLVDAYRRLRAASEFRLNPGIRAILDAALTRLPMAVVSNNPRPDIARILSKAGIIRYFCAIVGTESVAAAKPAPDIYREAAARLGLAGEECVAFEDSLIGIAAAKGAGCYTIGVTTGSATRKEFEESSPKPDFICDAPRMPADAKTEI